MVFIVLVKNDEIKSSKLDGVVHKIYYGSQIPVTAGVIVLLRTSYIQLG